MKLDVLSAMYFGTHRATRFAAASRLWSRTPEALHTVDIAFATDRAAVLGWAF